MRPKKIKNNKSFKRRQKGQIMAEYMILTAVAITGMYFILVEGGQFVDPSDGSVYELPSVAETIASREQRFNKSMYLPVSHVSAP